MIKVHVKTNTARQEVVAEVTDTPMQVLERANVGISRSMININGATLTATDLHSAFEALGVTDGDTVYLNSIVKADGAM